MVPVNCCLYARDRRGVAFQKRELLAFGPLSGIPRLHLGWIDVQIGDVDVARLCAPWREALRIGHGIAIYPTSRSAVSAFRNWDRIEMAVSKAGEPCAVSDEGGR